MDPYQLVTAIVAIFAFIETLVYKLPAFLLMLSDKEISEILDEYYKVVIPRRLKQQGNMDWLMNLTEELNLPANTSSSMRMSERKGRRALLLFLLSMILLVIAAVLPDLMYGYLGLIGLALFILAFGWFIDYYSALCQTRSNVVKMREKVRDLSVPFPST